jgi:hypothetical protein
MHILIMDSDEHILGSKKCCGGVSGNCSEEGCIAWVHYQAMYGGYDEACEVHDIARFEARPAKLPEAVSETFSFEEFRDKGVLFLLNTAVFHPRGMAVEWVYDKDDRTVLVGWRVRGDGTEVWSFMKSDELDDVFARSQAFLESLIRKVEVTNGN